MLHFCPLRLFETISVAINTSILRAALLNHADMQKDLHVW